jgi:hypothetical protein
LHCFTAIKSNGPVAKQERLIQPAALPNARGVNMKVLVVFCTVGLFMLPHAAHAEFKGCYERVYDKSYLKKHRKQEVVKIRLQLGVGKGSDGAFELLDRIDAGFRKRVIYDGGLVECKSTGEELMCSIAGDGGGFIVTDRGENSLRITNRNFMRFGGDDGVTLQAKSEHREFRLYRISTSACP